MLECNCVHISTVYFTMVVPEIKIYIQKQQTQKKQQKKTVVGTGSI